MWEDEGELRKRPPSQDNRRVMMTTHIHGPRDIPVRGDTAARETRP